MILGHLKNVTAALVLETEPETGILSSSTKTSSTKRLAVLTDERMCTIEQH